MAIVVNDSVCAGAGSSAVGWYRSCVFCGCGCDGRLDNLGYLRLWASKSEILRSNWSSRTWHMALWILVRRRFAFCNHGMLVQCLFAEAKVKAIPVG